MSELFCVQFCCVVKPVIEGKEIIHTPEECGIIQTKNVVAENVELAIRIVRNMMVTTLIFNETLRVTEIVVYEVKKLAHVNYK